MTSSGNGAFAQLRTERLLLVPIADEDVAALVRHWGEAAVARYLWGDQVMTPEVVATIVTMSDGDFRRHGYGVWALRWQEEGSLLGICGLRQVEGQDWIEILFSLRQRFWGQGLGTEAAFAVLDYAFGVLKLERVVALVDPSNTASTHILKRANMRFFSKDGERVYWCVTPLRFRAASKRPPPPSLLGLTQNGEKR